MLSVYAGARALQHIKNNGLEPTDVSQILGASGAAKWLAIAGLDKAIFGHWLGSVKHEIGLYGTSIGAFKLAAAAHQDPLAAIDRLVCAYTAQQYSGSVDADTIDTQMQPVLNVVAGAGSAEQVLQHPYLRLQFAAVRCLDGQTSQARGAQQLTMARAFCANLKGREHLARHFQRAVFSDPRAKHTYAANRSIDTVQYALTAGNFRAALTASGSLPVYMHAVEQIEEAAAGTYRDGGLLDYHPIPRAVHTDDGRANITLYPHFYPQLTEGWFDKFLPWRKVGTQALSDTVLLCPSTEFVAKLAGGKIPDRHDFKRFDGKDDVRRARWQQATEQSQLLGERFLDWTRTGEIADRVMPIN